MEKKYEEFVRNLREILIEHLGLKEHQIFFEEKKAEGRTQAGDRLFVELHVFSGGKGVCGIHTETLFGEYISGLPMNMIVKRVENEISKWKESGLFEKTRKLEQFEEVRTDLFIRLLNRNKQREELKSAIYQVVGDIAMVLYMQVGEVDGCISSIKVRKEYLQIWKKRAEEVLEGALLNTYFLSPPRIFYWEKLMYNENYTGECFMDLNHRFSLQQDSIGNCLSTVRRTNGAVAVFLPGVASKLAELMKGDFFMVFTSVHEVMIHNVNAVDAGELEMVLQSTLETATPEEDVLTRKIYRYCKDTGDILIYENGIPVKRDRPHSEILS